MNEIIDNDNVLSNESIGDVDTDVSVTDDVTVSDTPIPTDTPIPSITETPILDDSENDSMEMYPEVIVNDQSVDSVSDSSAETVQLNGDILSAVQGLDTSFQRNNYLLSAILFFVIFQWIEEKIFKSVRRLFINAGDH